MKKSRVSVKHTCMGQIGDLPAMIHNDIKPKIHELKTWTDLFYEVEMGDKTFEVRKNDRNFQVNDLVKLREFDPETQQYGKGEIIARISYILHGGQFGIEKGYCVLGLDKKNYLLPIEKKY